MGFPNNKAGKIEYDKAIGIDVNEQHLRSTFHRILLGYNFKDLKIDGDSISFRTNNSLFKIDYPVTIIINVKEKIIAKYDIALLQLLKVSIIVVVVAAFLSKMSITSFISFLIALLAAFYIINILVIDSAVRRIINDIFDKLPYINKEEYSDEQATWLNDTSRCPACGGNLSEYDIKCRSCGLSLPNRLDIKTFKPGVSTQPKQPEQNITYSFTEKKKTSKK